MALTPENLMFAVLGAVLGTLVGVLPGLGPPTTIALLLPLTYTLPLTGALIMLAGIFYGAMYGGSVTSILVQLPGEAASVVTTFDGYQMALQGRAAAALAVSAIGSFVAGTLGVVGMSALARPLAEVALNFGPPEYLGLTVLGLTLVAYLGGRSFFKGMAMALLGLLLGMVGLDPVYGTPRLTLGRLELMDGIDFVPLTMGVFGIGEVLSVLHEQKAAGRVLKAAMDWVAALRETWAARWAILRGSLVGFFVGMLPGGGAIVSSLLAYALEKRISRHPERFGRGAVEGVAAPESANNSGATTSFIPLLLLGVPGNASTALILAAMLIHGVRPGPFLLADRPDLFWGVIASMYIGNVLLLILNLPLVGLLARLLHVPYHYLAPVIVVLCVVGAYSVSNSLFDVWMLLLFGLLGYVARRFDFEVGPLIIAFVLGPLVERSLRQSLAMGHGSLVLVLHRPFAIATLALAAALVAASVLQWVRAVRWRPVAVGPAA